ncbi:MAG TPA: T9SS type A sorting domain-containing protein, partial [Chitinophagaceae bacterium]|nr:T9SS type A sorting domain-containing protein [Chitinophagaceae bacterium]
GYDYSRCYLSTNGEGGDCDKKLDPKPIRWDYKNEARRQQVYNVYSQLNRLRNHQWYKGVFQSSTIERSLSGAFKWIKLTTANDTSDLVVIGNFDVNPQTGTVTFPTAGTWYDYFGNFIHTSTGAAQSFTLQPGEYHVYLNRNVNGNVVTPVTNILNTGNTLEAKLFPNPSSTILNIEMYLPQSGTVSIDLLNSIGQHITVLHRSFMQRGKQQFTINKNKMNLPSGNYYVRINTKATYKILQFALQ